MTKPANTPQLLLVVTLFSIAMGFLECSVVVYIRKVYFPGGFEFPMASIEQDIALTELLRELATIVMLVGVGFMAGRNFISRFAWFLYSWAIWDIFYYVFLKMLLNWPESLMTNDVLFLIPVVWIGPVITPIIVAGIMIVLAFFLLRLDNKSIPVLISKLEWTLLIIGSIILISAFTWDYSSWVVENYSFSKIWVWPSNNVLLNVSNHYIPVKFNWFLYGLGVLVIIAGCSSIWQRYWKY